MLLFIWGVISFHNLPVEAYPDVANNYVKIITQWPGRAAEEVEQQVTIPLEIVDERNPASGAPALRFVSVRAFQRDADLRRRIGERLESRESSGAAFPGHSAARSAAADGHRLEPGRPDLLVHAAQHQPAVTT